MSNKKARGKRAKTRSKMKGTGKKATVNQLLREFKDGSRVRVLINPAEHSGMPHKGYHGSSGVVAGKQGKLHAVVVRKGSLQKRLLVHSAHLREAGV